MNKVNKKIYLWIKRKQYREKRREIKESLLRQERKKRKLFKIKEINCSTKTIVAPQEFGLIREESRKTLVLFLNKIQSQLSKGNKVHISFEETNTLLPCGTLWVTAKIEYYLKQYPRKITCTYPKDNVVQQLFQHIGLLFKLGKTEQKIPIESDAVRFWHYVSGSSTDDVSKFKDLLLSISLNEDIKSELFDSMSEAVTNTIHHAYKQEQIKNWWMFAQHKNGLLTVAICDFGIGIPKSLRQKPELKEWLASPIQRARKKRDTSLIEIAVESQRTKTKLPHRGKGLKDMLSFVKNSTAGEFIIFSTYGAFNYSASEKKESVRDYETSISGTLIQWHLSLDERNL